MNPIDNIKNLELDLTKIQTELNKLKNVIQWDKLTAEQKKQLEDTKINLKSKK
jgi:hypothetical protein